MRRGSQDSLGNLPTETDQFLNEEPAFPSLKSSVDPLLEYESVPEDLDNEKSCSSSCDEYEEEVHRPETAFGEFLVLLHLSWPIILTLILEYLPSIVTVAFVGHLGEKVLLDGAAIGSMFINIFGMSIGFGLATGLDTLCAQANGAGDKRQIGRWFQRYFLILCLLFIPVAVLNWFSGPIIQHVLQQPADVAELAQRYCRVGLLITPALWSYELLKKVFQTQGLVLPMILPAIVMNVVNVALSYWFMYYTPLGYDGSALARSISSLICPVVLLIYIKYYNSFDLVWPIDGWSREVWRSWGTAFKLGIPACLMMCLEWWAFEYQAIMCGLLPNSEEAIGAHSILFTITGFTYMFYLGIAIAVSVHVANLLGANQPIRARTTSVVGTAMSLGLGIFFAVLLFALKEVLPHWFIDDVGTAKLTSHVLPVLAGYQILDSVQAVFSSIFRGCGRQALGALFMFIAYYVIGLPFGIIGGFVLHLGVLGIWLGPTISLCVVFLFSLIALLRTDWSKQAENALERVQEHSSTLESTVADPNNHFDHHQQHHQQQQHQHIGEEDRERLLNQSQNNYGTS